MEKRLWVKLVVYVLLKRDGKILLGKRKNIFGDGHYSTPAGHIEKNETVMECSKRELREETGIIANKFEFKCVKLIPLYKINGKIADDQYIAFFIEAKKWKGKPKGMEPNKNEGWGWYSLNKLPNPMFPPVKMLVECYKKSVPFID